MTIHLLSSRNYGPRSRKSLVQGISLFINVGEAQEASSHCTSGAHSCTVHGPQITNLDLMQLKSQASRTLEHGSKIHKEKKNDGSFLRALLSERLEQATT